MGVTPSANFIPEIWANVALGQLEAELHMARNVARDYEFTPANEGDTIHIPKRGTLVATQKSANTDVTLQNPTATKVDVSLDQHWEVTFAVEDIVKAQANQDIMAGYVSDAITVLGEKIETSLAGLYTGLTTNNLGSANTNLTEAVILNVRKALSENRAPKSDRFLYLEPSQINVILDKDNFPVVRANEYGSAMPVQEGEIGSLYGMKVFETLFAQDDENSPVGTHNLAFHKNAFVLATRPLPEPKAPGVMSAVIEKNGIAMRVTYSYNAMKLADQVTIDVLFGVAVLREELGVDLLS